MKKSLDLEQEFNKLIEKIQEFQDHKTTDSLERAEIESLILQVHRLLEKLEKLMNIVGSNY